TALKRASAFRAIDQLPAAKLHELLWRPLPPGKLSGDRRLGGEPADQSGPAAAQRFTKEIWGELPAQQREELINALPDKFLPLYESMLEQYYRRLSTKKMK
ncbi:MAG: hypothetical protein ACKOUR_15635, partial [Planctomycetota bacterium]